MICNGCNERAKYLIIFAPNKQEQNCLNHMLEALGGVPVTVIDLDCLSLAQRKEVVKSGQAPIARTA